MDHIVEFLGTPGSGKTTLVPEVKTRISAAGYHAVDLARAVVAGARRSHRDSTLALLLRMVPQRIAQRLVSRSHERYLSLRDALVKNPDLVLAVLDATRHRGVDSPARERAMTWMLDTIWQYELSRSGYASDILVVDEGFGHRAVTLFGFEYGKNPGDFAALRRYIHAIPLPSLVVRVDADPELCFRRAGVPVRFRQLDMTAQREYLLDASACIDDTVKLLVERGVEVRVVANNGALQEARSQVGEQVDAWLASL